MEWPSWGDHVVDGGKYWFLEMDGVVIGDDAFPAAPIYGTFKRKGAGVSLITEKGEEKPITNNCVILLTRAAAIFYYGVRYGASLQKLDARRERIETTFRAAHDTRRAFLSQLEKEVENS